MAKRSVGRPQKFNAVVKAGLVKVVRQHGLTHGREIIERDGVLVNGEKVEVTVSLPTLAKIVKAARYPVALKRGRPKKVAASVPDSNKTEAA